MKKYSKEFLVSFRDTDLKDNLKIPALVDFMQDIAREHAMTAGLNFDLTEYYWIIIRSKINMIRTPKIDEIIKIETYHSGIDKLYAVREFCIFDKNNEKIGDITAYYLLMQQGKSTPIKIKSSPEFAILADVYTGEKIPKLTPCKEKLQKSETRKVFSSDIDGNGHMNNAHYVKWCFDMYETQEKKEIKSFQIQYVKELLENAEILVNKYSDGYIVGEFENTIYFIAKIEFKQ